MNERINELVLTARQQATSDTKDGSKQFDLDLFHKKFAELIVAECVNVLDKAQWDKGEDWVCADGTRIIPQIKDHFGVEE
jgi:hypothetical protein